METILGILITGGILLLLPKRCFTYIMLIALLCGLFEILTTFGGSGLIANVATFGLMSLTIIVIMAKMAMNSH